MDRRAEFFALAKAPLPSLPAPLRSPEVHVSWSRAAREVATCGDPATACAEAEALLRRISAETQPVPGRSAQEQHHLAVAACVGRQLKSIVDTVRKKEMAAAALKSRVAEAFRAGRAEAKVEASRGMQAEAELDPSWADAFRAEEATVAAVVKNRDLQQTDRVQKSVAEISALLGTMASKVQEQNAQAEAILEDVRESTEHVEEARTQFKKAKEHGDQYRFYILCWFLGNSFLLLLFDAIW